MNAFQSTARLLAIAATLTTTAATAQVAVEDAWARATVAQQKIAGAYMKLSAGSSTQLVATTSPVASAVEVHEMAMEGSVMKMRPVSRLELPAGKTVEFKPGGYHFMLMGLKQQLKPGDTVPMTLFFEGRNGQRKAQEIRIEVRALDAIAPAASHATHHP